MTMDREAFDRYFSDPPQEVDPSALDFERIPEHIAVIMDGNGRWAQQRGLSRSEGHAAGVDGLRELITATVRLGIPYLSVYAFSTENWSRPQAEVDTLMHLFATVLLDEMPLLKRENVKLKFIGDIDSLPQETADTFREGLEKTSTHTGTEFILAVNYGSRDEIVRAVRTIVSDVRDGELDPTDITPETVSDHLYTAGVPDPELLIRTSGEQRLSNFLLWQLAYTEFHITDVLWPDFDRYDLINAVADFQHRTRRFGGV